MKILWFKWKDTKHPRAGGAEIVGHELAKRLAKDGHEVIFITSKFENSLSEETIDGYKIIRVGNRFSVYWLAFRYYKKNLKGWADLVIDEVNTIPFFAKFYVKEKNILFIHQLCREIWFYEMIFPLSLIGYLAEPIYLWMLRNKFTITVSESSKNDLLKYGFNTENIKIISEGIEIEPIKNLEQIKKYDNPTILSLGSIRSMKRTIDIVKAFEMAKEKITSLKLIIAGDSSLPYGQKVLKYISKSEFKEDITCLGKVNTTKKVELMQKVHLIAVTSIKEGWGLVVTEANSQGTPAIVYNVDGLRDSVQNGKTGIICEKNNPENLAKNIIDLLLNFQKYRQIQNQALDWSKTLNFDNSYKEFSAIIGK
ncbi:MAG: glycosyl transferase, group 1 [uncultured bacterium]|nr:MAG: glycosyl transferase, group 1 [uncultured bacterium]